MNPVYAALASFIFWLGMWQLDHFVAPYIWKHKGAKIEVLPILFSEVTRFYVICFICISLGWFLLLIIYGLSI